MLNLVKNRRLSLLFAYVLGFTLTFSIAIFLFRAFIFSFLGEFLISEDELKPADALFVFSGAAEERSLEAARIVKQTKVGKIICTGNLIPNELKIMNLSLTEGFLSRKVLLDAGIDSTQIELLNLGTSTQEECAAILELCRHRQYRRIILVSSKFHTKRISGLIKYMAKNSGLQIIVRGAPPIKYELAKWQNSEDGLIFVNNEYVKLIYYALKYG